MSFCQMVPYSSNLRKKKKNNWSLYRTEGKIKEAAERFRRNQDTNKHICVHLQYVLYMIFSYRSLLHKPNMESLR